MEFSENLEIISIQPRPDVLKGYAMRPLFKAKVAVWS